MPLQRLTVCTLIVACCLLAPVARAASSAASSASDSIGASVGSVSGSLKNSSTSSTEPNRLAEGEYRIRAIVATPERAEQVTLVLVAAAGDEDAPTVELTLPQRILQSAGLAVGARVAARARDYGVEFADARTQVAFYLVLKDDWYEELQSRAVVL